jgi:hypothetical protein
MKIQKFLLALSLAGTVVSAQAALYDVSGGITGYSFQPPPGAQVNVTMTYNPSVPTFNGSWNIDTATPSLAGNLDYAPFTNTAFINVGNGLLTGTVHWSYENAASTLNTDNATLSYNALTRTLTATTVGLQDTGTPGVCLEATGIGYCPTPGPVENRGQGALSLVLYFNESLTAFTGTGTHKLSYSDGSADVTTWSFSGTEVPVPAALWLFGSGLAGLVGVSRRRSA